MLIKPVKTVISQRAESRRHVNMRFPSDIGAHCMVLNFKDYSYDASKTAITNISTTSSIVLPLPSNLNDTYTLNMSPTNLNLMGSGAAAVAGSTTGDIKSEAQSFVESIQGASSISNAFSVISNMAPDLGAYAKLISKSLVDQLPTGVGAGIDVALGATINPHTTLAFEGIALKSHSFSWTFAPKDQDESDTLLKIQNAIRRAILPRYSGDGSGDTFLGKALLKYPNLVDIFMLGVDQEYYYHFKPAMVKQFEMNFGGGGQSPAILKGGKPAIVTMTMQLDETQIHTADDYK